MSVSVKSVFSGHEHARIIHRCPFKRFKEAKGASAIEARSGYIRPSPNLIESGKWAFHELHSRLDQFRRRCRFAFEQMLKEVKKGQADASL